MSLQQKKIFWPALVVVVLSIAGIVFAMSNKPTASTRRPITQPNGVQRLGQDLPAVPASEDDKHVHRAKLPGQLRWNLNQMGDRLDKPGKERITITGTLTRADDTQPLDVSIVLEYPDQLRATVGKGNQSRVMTFDHQRARGAGSAISSIERDLIEMLVYDSADHFFSTQIQRKATRFLGNRFRAEDASPDNPAYDVYEVLDEINTSRQTRSQSKRYYFNSNTLLLEGVRYSIERNGSEIPVDIQLSDWQGTQGQAFPRRIVRLESNQPVLSLTISSMALSAKADDGIFAN